VLRYLKYFHYLGEKFDFAYDIALPKGGINVLGWDILIG